jgi:hypothetical protein
MNALVAMCGSGFVRHDKRDAVDALLEEGTRG